MAGPSAKPPKPKKPEDEINPEAQQLQTEKTWGEKVTDKLGVPGRMLNEFANKHPVAAGAGKWGAILMVSGFIFAGPLGAMGGLMLGIGTGLIAGKATEKKNIEENLKNPLVKQMNEQLQKERAENNTKIEELQDKNKKIKQENEEIQDKKKEEKKAIQDKRRERKEEKKKRKNAGKERKKDTPQEHSDDITPVSKELDDPTEAAVKNVVKDLEEAITGEEEVRPPEREGDKAKPKEAEARFRT
jgi:TolA-binding protein